MNCTCGQVQRILAPCIHIMSVLGDQKYIIADIMHVRWFKQCLYYYDTDLTSNKYDSNHYCFVTTVVTNKQYYTRAEIQEVDEARDEKGSQFDHQGIVAAAAIVLLTVRLMSPP